MILLNTLNNNSAHKYGVAVYRGSSQTGIADSAWDTIEFNTEHYDKNGDFDTSTYTFTAPIDGEYQISYSVRLSGTSITRYDGRIYVNGSDQYLNASMNTAANNGPVTISNSGDLRLSAGDTLVLQVFVNVGSGTATAYSENAYRHTYMSISVIGS